MRTNLAHAIEGQELRGILIRDFHLQSTFSEMTSKEKQSMTSYVVYEDLIIRICSIMCILYFRS